jgi:2-polyprenyl-6-methoxyphenol hydroxylase-like FAD-dependent oxidoreductase
MGAIVPHIGICGAGISGLVLAGILSRSLADRVRITVLERAAADRDQGYGLDLDENGQEALARAGVYHRYWEISRPFSDNMALFPMRGARPLGVIFRPALMRRLFPSVYAARPETNRGALRDVLLEAIAARDNTVVRFETAVHDLRSIEAGGLEILAGDGSTLGEFDLVVDAMGLHSTLRCHRVDDAAGGKHATGRILVHGVIHDPGATCSAELGKKLDLYGTVGAFGRGYGIVLQRFGAGAMDHRTSVFYLLNHLDSEAQLFEKIGITAPDSRAAGIMTDARLEKVKEWVLADMGDAFDPVWSDAIRCLDRVTVREEFTHGASTLRKDTPLPLVCIGDSLRNCGLGGGGILAMQDAIELSKLLVADGAFDRAGRPRLPELRAAESKMLERKESFASAKERLFSRHRKRIKSLGRGAGSLHDWFPGGWLLGFAGFFLAWFGRITNALYGLEKRLNGRVGSDASSPIFPNVRKVLERGGS